MLEAWMTCAMQWQKCAQQAGGRIWRRRRQALTHPSTIQAARASKLSASKLLRSLGAGPSYGRDCRLAATQSRMLLAASGSWAAGLAV